MARKSLQFKLMAGGLIAVLPSCQLTESFSAVIFLRMAFRNHYGGY